MGLNFREKLFDNVIKFCEFEYNERILKFDQLDTKAQQVAGFSGILLGILISFCRKDSIEHLVSVSFWIVILVIASILFLLVTILISLYSIKVKKIKDIPTFKISEKEFDLLNEFEAVSEEHYLNFLYFKIKNWKITFDSLSEKIETKGKLVLISQVILTLSLTILGATLLIILISYIL